MRFEWDENKRLLNIRKHEIDFVDAEKVFENETYTFIDERFTYDETRFVTLGLLEGEVVAIVHTETDKIIRLISIRRATRNEEIIYYNQVAN